MKFEIRSHYWPNTPNLREIKIFIDSKEIYSSFMSQDEVWELAKKCRSLDWELTEIANNIDD